MPKVREVAAKQAKADRRGTTWDLGSKMLAAIDPGDKHVGFAVFVKEHDGHPVCVYSIEITPDECADRIAGMLFRDELAMVAVEKFTLYADKAMDQIGSEMLTSELIGVIKYLVRVHNDEVEKGDPWSTGLVLLKSEGAHAKKAIRAQLKARGIERVGKVGDHTGDAEEQGWYWLYRLGEDTGEDTK